MSGFYVLELVLSNPFFWVGSPTTDFGGFCDDDILRCVIGCRTTKMLEVESTGWRILELLW